jgi:hypothetical protein
VHLKGDAVTAVRTVRPEPHDDVVVLRWPEEREEAERLALQSVPCLLLVEPGAAPPDASACLQDWIRMPADDQDVRARLAGLVHRSHAHPSTPKLDGYGQLSFRGKRVFLSPTDERVARVLVDAFDRAVPEGDIFRAVWPDGGNATKVRVHVSRLRKRLLAVGLEVTSIRNVGYRLHAGLTTWT